MGEEAKPLEVTHLIEERDDSKTEKEEGGKVSNYCNKLNGLLAASAWVVFVVISDTSCQLIQRKIPDLELNMLRFIVSLVCIAYCLLYRRQLPKLSKSQIGPVAALACCNFVTTQSIYTAVSMAPLASVRSICMTSVLMSGMILLFVCVNENITAKRLLPAILAICGIFLVLQPGFLFWKQHVIGTGNDINVTMAVDTRGRETGNTAFRILGHILPAIAGIATSSQIVLVKRFPFLGEEVFPVGFWSLSSGAAISALLMAAFEKPTLPQTWEDFAYLAAHCASYCVIWLAVVLSPMYISGNTVSIIF